MTVLNKIAFVGQMGAGKDTVASIFKDTHMSYAFGEGIRECVRILRDKGVLAAFGFISKIIPTRNYYDLLGILGYALQLPKTLKDRKILQYLGSSVRLYYDLVWVDYCLNNINSHGQRKVVITDCRRTAELEALRASGFTLIYVDAPAKVRFERLKLRDGIDWQEFVETSQHVAESEIGSLKDLCDFVLDNSTGNLKDVEEQINEIIKDGKYRCY